MGYSIIGDLRVNSLHATCVIKFTFPHLMLVWNLQLNENSGFACD